MVFVLLIFTSVAIGILAFCLGLSYRTVNQLKREAEKTVQMKDDLLTTVSHDLKNLLMSTKMRAELIFRAEEADDFKKIALSNLESIKKSMETMERLINDLLDLEKIRLGKSNIKARIEEVDSILMEVLEFMNPLAAQKNIKLAMNARRTGLLVLCDRVRIIQVFSNLIGNSIKFSSGGGSILIETRLIDDDVQFSVRDNGPGIKPEQLPFIFDRYWQGRHANPKLGIGLGLSIVKGIIEAHGRKTRVESEIGVGTCFTFTLPLVKKLDTTRDSVVDHVV